MKLIVLKNKKEVAEKTASIIEKEIKNNPYIVLGLATGSTMIPLYKTLAKLHKKNKIDFSKVKTFNLDEYLKLKKEDKSSYHHYMKKNLFNKTNIDINNTFFPSKNVKSYEKKIEKEGGIDLLILGIGINGHIGFNEPNSNQKSKTRVVNLTKNTISSNSKFFPKKLVPKRAITMGISTILKSRKIILLATGKSKADIIKKTLKSEPTPKIPSTFLKKHKNVLFIIDKGSASKL